ncbi:MAG: hypothetical protein EA397_18920 [Deltaproteobacteria bacterium]|nr:MAG: hypothetical protein EA397_18920 [Deltaproteobacteria bacterium]
MDHGRKPSLVGRTRMRDLGSEAPSARPVGRLVGDAEQSQACGTKPARMKSLIADGGKAAVEPAAGVTGP